jgi:hypothetical protein
MKKFPYPLLILQMACSGTIAPNADNETQSSFGGDGGGAEIGGASGGTTLDQGGSGGVKLPPAPSGSCRVAMPLRRLSDSLYRTSVAAVFGNGVTGSALFPRSELSSSLSGFSLDTGANSINTLSLSKMYDASEETALAVTAKLATFLPCSTSQPTEACAKTFIAKYAPLAFRRPISAADSDDLLTVFNTATGADAFKDGIALVVEAMLQSPSFLYMIENGVDRSSKGIALGAHEIATRLSFLTTGAPPDATLRAAADNGTLLDVAVLKKQVQRLLDLPESKPMVSSFVREWLHMPAVATDARSAPQFTPALAASMQKEFDLFVQDAFLSSDGTVESLLTSKRTFANSLLAPLYGMTAASDSAFSPITVDKQPRSGLLTLPAVLSAFAHQSETSYVFRGVMVRKRLLCEDFPAPPANAQNMGPTIPANATHAERSQLISAQSTCGGCHRQLDPVGLAFDRFDEIGRYRTTDASGKSIAANGNLPDAEADVAGAFGDVAELGQRLGKSQTAANCVALAMFRNAHSRMESDGDGCFIDELKNSLKSSKGNLRDLIVNLTSSESFRYRSLTEGETP